MNRYHIEEIILSDFRGQKTIVVPDDFVIISVDVVPETGQVIIYGSTSVRINPEGGVFVRLTKSMVLLFMESGFTYATWKLRFVTQFYFKAPDTILTKKIFVFEDLSASESLTFPDSKI